jgi:hypothetical protein
MIGRIGMNRTFATLIIIAIGSTLFSSIFSNEKLNNDIATVTRHQRSQNAEITSLKNQLNSRSLTGDLITCTDFHAFENSDPIVINGGYNTEWASITTWLPTHCYKG